MALGNIFFAWVDPEETTFGPEHERYDENVFSFQLEQNEGDFATLELEVRRPRNVAGDPIGLLAPGRKIWAWFVFDCGSGLVKFFGRLVGVTGNVLPEVVSIRLIARPADYAAQKAALADTLRVLPNYDPIFIDEAKRDDPDAVLEGYSKIWHIDRETHVVTVSDILVGEDTPLSLAADEMFFEGLDMAPQGVPLTSVSVNAELTWTQLAKGAIDFTDYITENWPNEPEAEAPAGVISSFTFGADNWPQNGASLGDGWEATESSAIDRYNTEVSSQTSSSSTTVKWYDGAVTTLQDSITKDELVETPPGSIVFQPILTKDHYQSQLAEWEISSWDNGLSRPIASWSRQISTVQHVAVLHQIEPRLLAAYDSARNCTELVSLVITADMQPILTEPGEDETLRIDNLRSVNLSEPLAGTGEIPIGDTGRRSYITTDRGQQSLQYMIAVARAHLRKRARAVEIDIAPRVGRFPEVSLRKSATINDPRLPGGQAFGKIISYSLALNGDDGKLDCKLKVGCPIGRGGTVTTVDGDPVYVVVGYVQPGYQAYEGRTILFDDSVGFSPPVFDPQDDGIDFSSPLEPEDVIELPMDVTFPPAEQRVAIEDAGAGWVSPPSLETDEEGEALAKARADALEAALKNNETRMRFKLKSMNGEFKSNYPITVTEMKIPTGFDLEAA